MNTRLFLFAILLCTSQLCAKEFSPLLIIDGVVKAIDANVGSFVGVYRGVDAEKGDFKKYPDLARWVIDPNAVTNKKPRGESFETFVLISAVSPSCPSIVNIRTFYHRGLNDAKAKTFLGLESSAFILILKKDSSWVNGDLYTLVGGYDSIIAKRDDPPISEILPNYDLLLDVDDFEALVRQLREFLHARVRSQ